MLELGDEEGGGGWRGEVQEGGIPGPEPGEGQWGRGPAVGEGTSSGGSLPPLSQATATLGEATAKLGEATFVVVT